MHNKLHVHAGRCFSSALTCFSSQVLHNLATCRCSSQVIIISS